MPLMVCLYQQRGRASFQYSNSVYPASTNNIGFCFSASFFSTNFYFGSTAISQIDNVSCNGTEPKLIDCPHSIVNHENYTSPQVNCRRSKFIFSCQFHRCFTHVLYYCTYYMYCLLPMASNTCCLLSSLLCRFNFIICILSNHKVITQIICIVNIPALYIKYCLQIFVFMVM